jgi:urease beta subunit
MRLNIPAGTAVRFEPGDNKTITLVELGGAAKVYGLNGLTNGPAGQSIEHSPGRKAACEAAKAQGFEGS